MNSDHTNRLRDEMEQELARQIDELVINGGNMARSWPQPADQPIRMNLPKEHMFTFVPEHFAKLGPPQEGCVWICFVTGMHMESTTNGMQIKLESSIMQVPKDSLRDAVEYQVKELHLEKLFGVDKPDAQTIAERPTGQTMAFTLLDEPPVAVDMKIPVVYGKNPHVQFATRLLLPSPEFLSGQFFVSGPTKVEP